jgi:hypothetical protein
MREKDMKKKKKKAIKKIKKNKKNIKNLFCSLHHIQTNNNLSPLFFTFSNVSSSVFLLRVKISTTSAEFAVGNAVIIDLFNKSYSGSIIKKKREMME